MIKKTYNSYLAFRESEAMYMKINMPPYFLLKNNYPGIKFLLTKFIAAKGAILKTLSCQLQEANTVSSTKPTV